MNSLVFNPNAPTIPEWQTIYLSEQSIASFEDIIDRTCNYLSLIANHKHKTLPPTHTDTQPNQTTPPPKHKLKKLKRKISIRDEGGIQRFVEQIHELKIRFQNDYQQCTNHNNHQQSQKSKKIHEENAVAAEIAQKDENFNTLTEVCWTHLLSVKRNGLAFYDEFLEQQVELLTSFISHKLPRLHQKLLTLASHHAHLPLADESSRTTTTNHLRTLFDNLYIETEYLSMLLLKNIHTLETHSEKQHSAEQPQILTVRARQFRKLHSLQLQITTLKTSLRQHYLQHHHPGTHKHIHDHHKLQTKIKTEISSHNPSTQQHHDCHLWLNGFVSAILLLALTAIIIFRQANITALEQLPSYQTEFQVWRGASYLILFNWVMAVVLLLLERLGINYRLITIEADLHLERPQAFFNTAVLLSALYLTLFLVYLLQQLGYISGHPHLTHLGYYMHLLNLCFLLNPTKTLNYHSRKWFLSLLAKFTITLFIPMNFNIFLVSLILASMPQPLNDLVFTVCSLADNPRDTCLQMSRNATFAYMLIFLLFRAGQSFRLHAQYSPNVRISRARQGLTAVIFTTNTVFSGYFYGSYGTTQLFHYWIVSACLSTLTGTNADLRADWGVISLDPQDCLLRKTLHFPRPVYFLCTAINLLLNAAWVLTISSNIASFLSIDLLYFYLLLTALQFCRRGMWITIRIEDDHSQNLYNLNALTDDSHLLLAIQTALNSKNQDKPMNQSSEMQITHKKDQFLQTEGPIDDTHSPPKQPPPQPDTSPELTLDLKQLQTLVVRKQNYLAKVQLFLTEINQYLEMVHTMYAQMNWEDQY